MAGKPAAQDLSAPDGPNSGALVDVQTRSAQNHGGGGGQIYVNLTDLGRRLHDIAPQDDLRVAVYEDGIWISK